MYGSPSYMVAYGATAPTLPSGKKFPLIYFGDTNASVQAASGIDDVITFYANTLYEKLLAWDSGQTGDDPFAPYESKMSKGADTIAAAIGFMDNYNPSAGGRMSTFGDGLDGATQLWQAIKGLKVDGQVGANTWSSLGLQGRNTRSGSAKASSSSSSSGSTGLPSKKANPVMDHLKTHQEKYLIGGTIFVIGMAAFVGIFYQPKSK